MVWPSDRVYARTETILFRNPSLIAGMQGERPSLALRVCIDHDFAVAADGSHRSSKIYIKYTYVVQEYSSLSSKFLQKVSSMRLTSS